MTGDFFVDEADFQNWLSDNCELYAAHVQPITGDPKYPGIPDLSIGMFKLEVWAEVKCWRTEHYIHTPVKVALAKGRKLTTQQKSWLKNRSRRGAALCGVLLAWRTPHSARYVSFIPIQKWDEIINNWTLAGLALSIYTETLNRIKTGKTTVPALIREVQHSLICEPQGASLDALRTTNQ